jgi:hypothetical protein
MEQPAHFVADHREKLGWADPLRNQSRDPPQRGLLVGKPA